MCVPGAVGCGSAIPQATCGAVFALHHTSLTKAASIKEPLLARVTAASVSPPPLNINALMGLLVATVIETTYLRAVSVGEVLMSSLLDDI